MRVYNILMMIAANVDAVAPKDSTSRFDDLIRQLTTVEEVKLEIIGPFFASLSVLVLCSLIKYVVSSGNKMEWGKWALEFPVDTAAILVPLFATLYLPLSFLWFILIIISILMVLFCSLIRRKAINLLDGGHYWRSAGWGILSHVLVCVWIVVLMYVIF